MILSKDNLVKLLSDFLGNDILLNDDQILNRRIKEARENFEKKYLKYNLEKLKLEYLNSDSNYKKNNCFKRLMKVINNEEWEKIKDNVQII